MSHAFRNMKNRMKSEAPPPISKNDWLTLVAATLEHFHSVHLEVGLSYIKEIE